MKKSFPVFLFILFLFVLSGEEGAFDIKINMVYASSTLPDDAARGFPYDVRKIRYAADRVFDGNPATVWSEGTAGAGLNECIYLTLAEEIAVDEIVFLPGFFSEKYFKANNRVKRAAVENEKGGRLVMTFSDKMEAQRLKIKTPLAFSELKITVLEVYAGEKWNDTCIAEITFYRQGKKYNLVYDNRIEYKNNQYILPAGIVSVGLLDENCVFNYFTYYFSPDGTVGGGELGNQIGVNITDGTWNYLPDPGYFYITYNWVQYSPNPMAEGPLASGSETANLYILGSMEDLSADKNVSTGLIAGMQGPFINY